MSERTKVLFEKTVFWVNNVMLRFRFCPHALYRWMVEKCNLKGLPICRTHSRANFKHHAFFSICMPLEKLNFDRKT